MNPTAAQKSGEPPPTASLHVTLYDAEARDQILALDDVDVEALQDQQLLWIDMETADAATIQDVGARLGLPGEVVSSLQNPGSTPGLHNFSHCFHVRAVAVRHAGKLVFEGVVFAIVVGTNFVVTVHRDPMDFLDQLRERERGDTDLGVLNAESFSASLLDWHLSTYFDALSDFEAAVERLEVDILSGGRAQRLEDLQRLRRGASRLRRMLAPHRALFAAMARPDFRPRQEGETNGHFRRLDTHYERAMSMVENARDLVIGSFELFTSYTAWRTNELVRALTFFTVLLGVLAVIAGVLGMNFDAAIFETSSRGFWIAVIAMVALASGAIVIAKLRRWI